MLKIYIAGPDVFFQNALEIGNIKKEICRKYGFEGVYPLDLLPEDLFTNKYNLNSRAKIIKKACVDGIIDSHILVANMTPFRGVSMDVGTACEIGLADMSGLDIYGYSLDDRHYIEKVIDNKLFSYKFEGVEYDINGSIIENFSKIDNCMITEACKNIFFKSSSSETHLELFEKVIKHISEINNNNA
jgi:nucleoside 2-deoxyribosyltransferase